MGALWHDRAYDLVIAAGGDGTIGSVATQLAGSGVPLAILPLGTANDVARSLHMPMDVEEACVAIAGALPMDIDVGQVMPGLTAPLAYSAEARADAARPASHRQRRGLFPPRGDAWAECRICAPGNGLPAASGWEA